jgi:hypothetical protein
MHYLDECFLNVLTGDAGNGSRDYGQLRFGPGSLRNQTFGQNCRAGIPMVMSRS